MNELETPRIMVSFDAETGSFTLLVDGKVLVNTLTLALFYADDWIGEATGNIVYKSGSCETRQDFEGNPAFFGTYELVSKVFSVESDGDSFEIVVNAVIFPEQCFVYFYADINGAGSKFDKIAGYIDIGVPEITTSHRYFHGSDVSEPATLKAGEANGMDFFNTGQHAFHDSGISATFPTNDRLSITYLLTCLDSGASVGYVPVNRFGQRTLIRCCELLELPVGLKFVSGTYLKAGSYEKMAGGILAIGDDPVLLSKRIFELYMQLVNRSHVLRWYKEYPEMFEYLGFCTWNTFYRNVSHAKMEELCEKNFTGTSGSTRFKYLILDDGWQSTNEFPLKEANCPGKNFHGSNFLQDIQANFKFPNGLEPLNRLLKQQYGFKWWGVWHAIAGYWQGVDANNLGKVYPCVASLGHNTPDPADYKGYKFWVDYYKYMRQAGVDMVKIDNQSSIGSMFDGIYPIDDAIEKYYLMQQGAATGQNIAILNCMAQASDCKIYWSKSNVSRVSGDFGPGNFRSMKAQVRQGVFQPLFFAQFCWPDHDMVQTVGPTEPLLLLHMVSGGPVYIADDMGMTNGKVCEKLSFSDGRLPRLDTPSMPTIDVIFADTDKDAASKAWSYHDLDGWGRVFYYYIANALADDEPVEATIGLDDMGEARFVPTIETGKVPPEPWPSAYVLADISEVPAPASALIQELGVDERSSPVSLENWEARYFCLSPLHNGIALLGIDEVWNGTKAIASAHWIDWENLAIVPAHAGILRVYAKSDITVTVSSATGEQASTPEIERSLASGGKIVKVPIDSEPIILRLS
ncbi:MAG TPA: Sip1-related alpha-galactosidase [Candidatus Lokiarchaeia archaeon]|nr:Sip1-related alpha-galactosidase [Candidatus Lokiarchaeia archaeon]